MAGGESGPRYADGFIARQPVPVGEPRRQRVFVFLFDQPGDDLLLRLERQAPPFRTPEILTREFCSGEVSVEMFALFAFQIEARVSGQFQPFAHRLELDLCLAESLRCQNVPFVPGQRPAGLARKLDGEMIEVLVDAQPLHTRKRPRSSRLRGVKGALADGLRLQRPLERERFTKRRVGFIRQQIGMPALLRAPEHVELFEDHRACGVEVVISLGARSAKTGPGLRQRLATASRQSIVLGHPPDPRSAQPFSQRPASGFLQQIVRPARCIADFPAFFVAAVRLAVRLEPSSLEVVERASQLVARKFLIESSCAKDIRVHLLQRAAFSDFALSRRRRLLGQKAEGLQFPQKACIPVQSPVAISPHAPRPPAHRRKRLLVLGISAVRENPDAHIQYSCWRFRSGRSVKEH